MRGTFHQRIARAYPITPTKIGRGQRENGVPTGSGEGHTTNNRRERLAASPLFPTRQRSSPEGPRPASVSGSWLRGRGGCAIERGAYAAATSAEKTFNILVLVKDTDNLNGRYRSSVEDDVRTDWDRTQAVNEFVARLTEFWIVEKSKGCAPDFLQVTVSRCWRPFIGTVTPDGEQIVLGVGRPNEAMLRTRHTGRGRD